MRAGSGRGGLNSLRAKAKAQAEHDRGGDGNSGLHVAMHELIIHRSASRDNAFPAAPQKPGFTGQTLRYTAAEQGPQDAPFLRVVEGKLQ